MRSDPPGTSDVESVTVRLAGLDITLTARRIGETTSVGVSAEVEGAETEPTHSPWVDTSLDDPFQISVELEQAAISARGPAELSALSLPFLAYLVPRLRSTTSAWTPVARLHRAFRAGVIAHRRLNGEVLEESSEGIPLRNSFYICLRTPGNCTIGFWTVGYAIYWSRVRSNATNEFHPDSISHSFPSRAEAEAYLRGARRRWPPEA